MLSYYTRLLNLAQKEPIRRFINGSINVRLGQELEPHEIIGLNKKTLGFRVFPLPKILSVRPQEVEKYLQKAIGAYVYKGETIAQRVYLGNIKKITFASPIDAIVKSLDPETGSLVLEFIPELIKVPAGVCGKVIGIIPGQGVTIESSALFLKSKVGLGLRREGVLQVITDPGIPIPLSSINDGLAGKILLGGSLLTREVLYRLISARVKGVICGGINFADFSALLGKRKNLEDIGLTILVVHGFGNLPLNETVYQALKNLSGLEAIISGFSKQLLIPLRKEKVETYLRFSHSENELTVVRPQVGNRVRLLSWGHLNVFGTIKKLGQKKISLPSGLFSFAATVLLDSGEEVLVPYQNLEISEPPF